MYNFSTDMKFILPGPNIKILGKAIHCLAKIGDEVFLEPESTQLSIMTVNLSRFVKTVTVLGK